MQRLKTLRDNTEKLSHSKLNVLVDNSEDPMFGAALRGMFIIDGDGKIRSMQINNVAVGRSVDVTLRLIKAF